jgi:hypothetical protein
MNLERKVYETRSQKVGDFFIGVGLCIGLNILLSMILTMIVPLGFGVVGSITTDSNLSGSIFTILGIIAYGLPCIIQIGLIIYFGLTRYWIALGMLAAIALGLLITLLLGAACFALIAGLSGGFGK